MPEKLLKIVLRRLLDTIQNQNTAIKAGYSGDYWQFHSAAYRDALIEAGIKFEFGVTNFWNGSDFDSLTTNVRILSKTDEYRHILTGLGFASDISDGIPTYSFKI